MTSFILRITGCLCHCAPHRIIPSSDPLWWNPLAVFSKMIIDALFSLFWIFSLSGQGKQVKGERNEASKGQGLTFWQTYPTSISSLRYQNSSSSMLASRGIALEYVPLAPIWVSVMSLHFTRAEPGPNVTVRKINGVYHPTVDYKLLIVWISVWRLELSRSLFPQSLISTDIVHYFPNASPRYIRAGQIPEENNNSCCRYLRAVIITVAN